MLEMNPQKLLLQLEDNKTKKSKKPTINTKALEDFEVPLEPKRPQTNKFFTNPINEYDIERAVNTSFYKEYVSEERNINNILFKLILDEIIKNKILKEEELSKGRVNSYVTSFSMQTQMGNHEIIGEFASNENQDSYNLIQNFMLIHGLFLFGVFDGHGNHGHEISNNARIYIPSYIHYREIEKAVDKKRKNLNSLINSLIVSNEMGGYRNMNIIKYLYEKLVINPQEFILTKCSNFNEISDLFKEALKLAQNNLINNMKSIDSKESGSTVCLNVLSGKYLFVANSGDSRSLLCSYSSTKMSWISHQLTKDHKPNEPSEQNRIISKGGKVAKSKDEYSRKEYGPPRVWFKDMSKGPGLAMSRSYGEGKAHSIGVTEEPDVFEYILDSEDKIIVTASDGVWEYLSNDNVMEVLAKDYEAGHSAIEAADNLIQLATSTWKSRSKKIIDDITCIVLFLNVN